MYYKTMRINNDISFGAKKPIIRRLDDINRSFIQDYSFVKSPTKLLTRFEKKGKNILAVENEKYCEIANLWDCKVILLREKKFRAIEKLIKEVQETKCANCQELCEILSARLTKLGYKPKKTIFNITTPNKTRKMQDHMFLLINPKGSVHQGTLADTSAIVVDPFFGFVEYAPSAIMRFSRELGLEENEKLKFKILDK